tara:strand:+ start:63 stop:194 length:132 start_codon:yes stop_codon:yes gene_type:complete
MNLTKGIAILFICLIVIAKVWSKVAPTSAKTLRGTSSEISKSE